MRHGPTLCSVSVKMLQEVVYLYTGVVLFLEIFYIIISSHSHIDKRHASLG